MSDAQAPPRLEPDAALLEELAAAAAALTGFSRDAIHPDAVKRAARALLAEQKPEDLRARLRSGERGVKLVLSQAVTVGETFFFRQAEHFRFLGGQLLPELLDRQQQRIRVWSAGCATGEEAWSIAACLQDLTPPGLAAIEVLATDLLARNLAVARAASYGAWSQRPSAPLLHPVVKAVERRGGAPVVQVEERLRPLVRFAEHNLLDPIGDGPFDAIFCRNVLVYFSPEAAQRALANLAAALAPGGALLLGSMDATFAPPGLVPADTPEAQIWRRPDPSRARPLPESRPPRAGSPWPRKRPSHAPEPVALHLRALVLVERGDHATATRVLEELVREAPDYLPGLLERALLHVRQGERTAATALMREVLRRTEKLPPEQLVAAPEPLPISFFVQSAEAFLRSPRVRG